LCCAAERGPHWVPIAAAAARVRAKVISHLPGVRSRGARVVAEDDERQQRTVISRYGKRVAI
jgi:hypothetical protein